jgi:hypothetical protein
VSRLSKLVEEYIDLLESGETVVAMERFFADEVMVFENQSLACAGRKNAIAREKAALKRLVAPPKYRCRGYGVSPDGARAYIEWETRFLSGAEYARLDEVVAQEWNEGEVVLERHYYEGIVDEGDEES